MIHRNRRERRRSPAPQQPNYSIVHSRRHHERVHRDEDVCEICTKPTYDQPRQYGLIICQDCCDFMVQYLDQDRNLTCTNGGNCQPKWIDRRVYFFCDPCRWLKIMHHPNLEHSSLFEAYQRHASQRGVALSNQLIDLYRTRRVTAGPDVKNKSTSNGLECEICHNFNRVEFRIYGPLCCKNCYGFMRYCKKEGGPRKRCKYNGNCEIDWRKSKNFCKPCRWDKFTRHPKFNDADRTPTPPSAEKRRRKLPCEVCAKPDGPRQTNFGLYCCSNCSHFITRTIEKKNFHRECRQSTGNCEIKWKRNDWIGPCIHCRWKKIVSLPSFTYREELATKPLESSVVNRSLDEQPNNTQQVEPEPERPICSICENPNGVSLSKYGPNYCRDCLEFVDSTIEQRNDFTCYHEGSSINIKLQDERRLIMCQSCAWMKIKRDPNFKCEIGSGTSTKVFEEPDDDQLDDVIVAPTCQVCDNPNLVFSSERFEFSLCVRCLKLVIDTKERNLIHKCPASDNCDIHWAPDKELCGACRLRALTSKPNVKLET